MKGYSDQIEAVFPLSPTQEGMLYHTLHNPGSGVYIGQHTFELSSINVRLLKQAWCMVCSRHAALRTMYIWEELSRTVQMVMKESEPEWHDFDMRGISFDKQAWCFSDLKKDFDLSKRPPSRLSLLILDNDRFLLVWTRHHMMVDGWSAHIVLDDFKEAYASLANNTFLSPTAAPSFSTYIGWLQQQNNDISKNYWHSVLYQLPNTPGLESFRLTSRGLGRSRRIERQLATEFTEQLVLTARNNNLTLSTLVHGAWAAVLIAINESKSLTFGSTVSGRPHDLPQHDAIVGNFINTIPVLVNADGEDELSVWLQQLQQQVSESAQHGHIANREILEAAEIPPATALFDSIVVFMNYPQSNDTDRKLSLSESHYQEHSHYPFAVLVVPGGALKLIVIHDTDIITIEKADLLLNLLVLCLKRLSSGVTGSANHFFNSLRPELSELTSTSLTVEPIDVVQRFKDTIIRHGQRPAVNELSRTLSYKELFDASSYLASLLREQGTQPGDRILINMPRTIEGIVCIWAILLCGASYVPVAPSTPGARLKTLYSRVSARLLISPVQVPECESVFVLDSIDKGSHSFHPAITNPSMTAYVVFTSGSTGEPKKVTVSHRNLAYSLAARLQYYTEQAHNYALLSSFAFDSSVAGIFWTAATGGCLTLISEDVAKNPATLANELGQHQISALLALPSVYRVIIEIASDRIKNHLKLAIVAGEACPDTLQQLHFQHFPDAALVNEYGPSEATVWCSAYQAPSVSRHSEPMSYLPIGRPIPGVCLHILDKFQRPVLQGFIGELYVSGQTITQSNTEGGLYATGDLVELNSAGELVFHGRRDEQLKIRGHRIDPNEIEIVLQSHPDVSECVVAGLEKPILTHDIEELNAALNHLPETVALELLAELEVPDE